ncbi:MAG TPA: hypothetical protein VN207_06600 [Ktedonobacteraceae bacterium]|nr:hypothetical protein [Ktedonobacteraceae bacterium]
MQEFLQFLSAFLSPWWIPILFGLVVIAILVRISFWLVTIDQAPYTREDFLRERHRQDVAIKIFSWVFWVALRIFSWVFWVFSRVALWILAKTAR